MAMSPAKTPEPIDMFFGLWTYVGWRNDIVDGVPDPPGKWAISEAYFTSVSILNFIFEGVAARFLVYCSSLLWVIHLSVCACITANMFRCHHISILSLFDWSLKVHPVLCFRHRKFWPDLNLIQCVSPLLSSDAFAVNVLCDLDGDLEPYDYEVLSSPWGSKVFLKTVFINIIIF